MNKIIFLVFSIASMVLLALINYVYGSPNHFEHYYPEPDVCVQDYETELDAYKKLYQSMMIENKSLKREIILVEATNDIVTNENRKLRENYHAITRYADKHMEDKKIFVDPFDYVVVNKKRLIQ